MTKLSFVLLMAGGTLVGGCATVFEPDLNATRPPPENPAVHGHNCSFEVAGLHICRGCRVCRIDPTRPLADPVAFIDGESHPQMPAFIVTWPGDHLVWHGRAVGTLAETQAQASRQTPADRDPRSTDPDVMEPEFDPLNLLVQSGRVPR